MTAPLRPRPADQPSPWTNDSICTPPPADHPVIRALHALSVLLVAGIALGVVVLVVVHLSR